MKELLTNLKRSWVIIRKNVLSVLVVSVISSGLLVSLTLVQKPQDIRRKAAGEYLHSNPDTYVLYNSYFDFSVGATGAVSTESE